MNILGFRTAAAMIIPRAMMMMMVIGVLVLLAYAGNKFICPALPAGHMRIYILAISSCRRPVWPWEIFGGSGLRAASVAECIA